MTTRRPPRGRRPKARTLRPWLDALEPRLALAAPPTSAIVAAQAQARHAPGGVRILRDVPYRDSAGDRQVLDLCIPAGPAPVAGRPVVVAIHGGGWRKFSKEQYEPTVAPLAKLGFIVAVPDYRLSRPGAPTWPINLDEVRDAVRWVRSNAAGIGADPGRIAAMGASAGGHLAAMLGTDPEASTTSARVQAVVDFYGPADLSSLVATSPAASGAVRQYLGSSPGLAPALYSDASPVSHASAGDPPFLIVQGSADTLVPPEQSEELSDRLSQSGVSNRLILVPGAPHGFGLRAGGLDLLDVVASFLDNAPPTQG